MGAAAAGNLALNLAAPPSLPWAVLPMFLYNFGNSLIIPSLTLLALDHFPEQRGLASSCQMFLQSMCSVLVGAIAPLAWGSALSLAIGMACLGSIGAVCAWLHHRWARLAPGT
jgi:DHA1 family bicyclomycin/chloramphenicol resistance-like MFS transporter